jgi:hypothetical protein
MHKLYIIEVYNYVIPADVKLSVVAHGSDVAGQDDLQFLLTLCQHLCVDVDVIITDADVTYRHGTGS